MPTVTTLVEDGHGLVGGPCLELHEVGFTATTLIIGTGGFTATTLIIGTGGWKGRLKRGKKEQGQLSGDLMVTLFLSLT